MIFIPSISNGEKILAMQMRLCEDKLKGKTAHFRLPSVIGSLIGSLSTRVFETRTATGSELFSLLTCLHTTAFASPSINMTRTWDKEKTESPVGIEPVTSRTPGGRSIHRATRTHGEEDHLTEYSCSSNDDYPFFCFGNELICHKICFDKKAIENSLHKKIIHILI